MNNNVNKDNINNKSNNDKKFHYNIKIIFKEDGVPYDQIIKEQFLLYIKNNLDEIKKEN